MSPDQKLERIQKILEPIIDPVTPEATHDELADAIREIINVVHPGKAIYAPGRR